MSSSSSNELLSHIFTTNLQQICDSLHVDDTLLSYLEIYGIITPGFKGSLGRHDSPHSKALALCNFFKNSITDADLENIKNALKRSGNTKVLEIVEESILNKEGAKVQDGQVRQSPKSSAGDKLQDPASILAIAEIMEQDPVLGENWSNFIYPLGLTREFEDHHKIQLLLGQIKRKGLYIRMLENWVQKTGDEATVSNFCAILIKQGKIQDWDKKPLNNIS